MLLASIMRGTDGTGIVTGDIDIDEQPSFSKTIKTAPECVNRAGMIAVSKDARWVLTHVRSATVGTLTDEACHPFSAGELVGVHNGTVWDVDVLFSEYTGVNDSEIIYKALADVPPEEATDVLAKITSGAYALVWYDRRIKSLRFVRNHERPLWFYKTANYWWWNSEPGAIAACITREGKDYLSYGTIVPWQLKSYTLMTVPLDGSEATVEEYTPLQHQWHTPPAAGTYTGWDNQAGAHDAWDCTYPFSAQSGKHAATAAESQAWLSICNEVDLVDTPTWCEPYLTVIIASVREVMGAASTPYEQGAWNNGLLRIAARSGTSNNTTCMSFVAQQVDKSGMCFGAAYVEPVGWLPCTAFLNPQQMSIYNKGQKKVSTSTSLPLIEGHLTSLKAYWDGAIGLFLSTPALMGWREVERITKEEEIIGGVNTHPHILGNTMMNSNINIDWSIWT